MKEYIKSVFFEDNKGYVSLTFFGVVVVVWLGICAPFNYIKQKIAYRKRLKEANKNERRKI